MHAEFLRLLPTPPRPIPIQRWTLRRVGLLAAMVLLLVLVSKQGLGVGYQEPVDANQRRQPGLYRSGAAVATGPVGAVSVLVPCLHSLPAGWMMGNVTVNDGRSVIPLNHDRAGTGVLVIRLTATCDTQGATQVRSNQPQVRRYQRIDRQTPLRGHPL